MRTGTQLLLTSLLVVTLGACGPVRDSAPDRIPVDPDAVPNPIPKPEPRSKSGNPRSYEVLGKTYVLLKTRRGYRQRGLASWYGTKFHGQRTSSGEPYDMFAMTAAHKTLPIPCYARVTNLENGRHIIVRINDRGPFHVNRIIDLSYVAAAKLDMLKKGTAKVLVESIDPTAPERKPAPVVASTPPEADEDSIAAIAGDTSEGTPGTRNRLYLQVAAYAHKVNAEKARAKLIMLLGQNIIIHPADSIYKLWVGPLENVEDADRVSAKLATQGYAQTQVVID
jgi:rare lipoprotein A